MIEVELKYQVKNLPLKLKSRGADKIKEQEDIYYDTEQYDLIKNGNFLRIRNNKVIEFKLNIGDSSHLYCKETTFTIEDIANKQKEINKVFESLNLPRDKNFIDLDSFILENKLNVLASIRKQRTVYNIDKTVSISFDDVEDLGYFIEAEKGINEDSFVNEDEIQKAKNDLIRLLEKDEIISEQDRKVTIGYVELYLKKHNPVAYELGLFKD